MVMIGVGTALWSTSPYNVPVSLPGITWQGYTFTGTHIMAALLAGVIAGLLYLLLYRTRYGKAIRAVASNREAAELSGIPTSQVLAMAFGLGVSLAFASGMLIATLFPFTVLSGRDLPAQELRGDRAGRPRQSGWRPGRRRRARAGRGAGDAVHAGELDADHRVRAVRAGADRVSARHFRLHQGLTVRITQRHPQPMTMNVATPTAARKLRGWQARVTRPTVWLILLIAALFMLLPWWTDDVSMRESFLLAAVYITLASSLNLMIGYAGYINFGNIVFFGLGGYVCVYLVNDWHWPVLLAALVGGVCGERAGDAVRLRHPAAARRVLRALDHRHQRGGARSSSPISSPGAAPPASISRSTPMGRSAVRCRRCGRSIS